MLVALLFVEPPAASLSPVKPVPVMVTASPIVSVRLTLVMIGRRVSSMPRSYRCSSALLRAPAWYPPAPYPPATSNLPEGSSVALCRLRAVIKLLAALQVLVAGSYRLALLVGLT